MGDPDVAPTGPPLRRFGSLLPSHGNRSDAPATGQRCCSSVIVIEAVPVLSNSLPNLSPKPHLHVKIDHEMSRRTIKYTEGPIERKDQEQWNGNIQGLPLIAHGSAGMVFALDDARVVKVYIGEDGQGIEDMETEREAYRRLRYGGTSSRHVLKCYDLDNAAGLVFERCKMTVRRWVKSRDYAPQREALRLATEAAKGLEFVHKSGIIQGDGSDHCSAFQYAMLIRRSWLS